MNDGTPCNGKTSLLIYLKDMDEGWDCQLLNKYQ